MDQKWKKLTAELICGAVLVTGFGSTMYALNNDKNGETAQAATASQQADADKKAPTGTLDETVYVLASANGSVNKCIVSDWLDKTDADSYTQQESSATPPVEMKVTYQLDGVTQEPEKIAGQSGKMKIRFDYTNNQKQTAEIQGEQKEIYVPFAALTGVVLDNEIFTNVHVTNGRLVNDGSRTLVAGVAFPGLAENLELSQEDLEIPAYLEIEADVKNFSMANTMTLVTNAVFSELDETKLDSADDLKNAVGKMSDAVDQLLNGSTQLYDGLNTLYEKSVQLADGAEKLTGGAKQLQTGAAQLNNGALALNDGAKKLTGGLDQLVANNDTLNAGAAQIFDALLSTANEQLAQAGVEVPTLTRDNYAKVLTGVIASLDETNVAATAQQKAKEAVTQAVEARRGEVEAAVTDAVKQQVQAGVTDAVKQQVQAGVTDAVKAGVTEKVLAAAGMTVEQYEQGVAAGVIPQEKQDAVNAAVEAQMTSDAVQQMITAKTAEKLGSDEMQQLISTKTTEKLGSKEMQQLIQTKVEEQVAALIEQNMNSPEVQAKITAALEQARSGAASISALKGQLDGVNTFYNGLQTYTSGVAAANNGAHQLEGGLNQLGDGAKKLASGSDTLAAGLDTMNGNMPALLDGVAKLRDGDKKLADGMKEFREQGVDKLANAVNGDLDGIAQRLQASVRAAKEYRSFANQQTSKDSRVKFVYRTAAVD